MKTLQTLALTLVLLVLAATTAIAANGHFITNGKNAPSCADTGLTVECSGKVAGLGGEFFEIVLDASGVASVECTNPGGNVAPGQDFDFDASATSGPIATPRNGQYAFTLISTAAPAPPAGSCPNPMWSAAVVNVTFTTATLTLFEDGVESDQVTVAVS